MIRHQGGKFVLFSQDGAKKLGTFNSLGAAEKHEREVNYFKHVKKEGSGSGTGSTGGSGTAGPYGSGSPLGTADLGAGGKLVADQRTPRCRECRLGPRGLTRCCKNLLHSDSSHVDEQGVSWVAKHIHRVVHHQGIKVHLDRPKGFVQSGTSPDGKEWSRTYQNDYGFIPLTAGGDEEEIDVFLGPSEDAPVAFWALQLKPDGSFDEYKVFLGCDSLEQASGIYAAHIPLEYLGAWSTMSVGQMRGLLGQHPHEALEELTRKMAPLPPDVRSQAAEMIKPARELSPLPTAPVLLPQTPPPPQAPRRSDSAREKGWEPPMKGATGR
jgi:Inorganic Pyrophosphatase